MACVSEPLGEVKKLLKEMIDCKVYPNVKKGWWIMKQQNVVLDLVACNALMYGYSLQGRLHEARKLFDSMACKIIVRDVRSFSILITGYCKKMKIEDAVDLFREMRLKGLNVVTYTSMLQGLLQGGRCFDARMLFDELRAAGIKQSYSSQNVSSIGSTSSKTRSRSENDCQSCGIDWKSI